MFVQPLNKLSINWTVEKLELGGLVLGVVSDISEHIDEAQIALEPGDQLLFYTDGVTEAMDTERAPYGLGRLEELLRLHGQHPPDFLVSAVISSVEDFATGTAQHDDITLMSLRRSPV